MTTKTQQNFIRDMEKVLQDPEHYSIKTHSDGTYTLYHTGDISYTATMVEPRDTRHVVADQPEEKKYPTELERKLNYKPKGWTGFGWDWFEALHPEWIDLTKHTYERLDNYWESGMAFTVIKVDSTWYYFTPDEKPCFWEREEIQYRPVKGNPTKMEVIGRRRVLGK